MWSIPHHGTDTINITSFAYKEDEARWMSWLFTAAGSSSRQVAKSESERTLHFTPAIFVEE